MKTPFAFGLTWMAAALMAWLLTACGGGGSSDSSDAVSQDKAQSMSADSSALSTDGTDGAVALLTTTQAVVALSSSASATVSCGGGGSATFTATGTSPALLANGQLDAGEVYSVTLTNCRASSGAVTLNGTATLSVAQAGGGVTAVDTTTQNLQVALPLRTLTFNGSSSFSHTVAISGSTTIITNRWVSPQIVVKSVRNGTLRTSTFTLSNVDMTRTFTLVNGVLTATSFNGTYTMDAVLPNAMWSITAATQGGVTCDVNGVPIQGAWTITLPNNRVGISVVPGTLTVTVDFGADGSIDRTFVFSTATVVAGAD
jgi:hypothetical protein